MSNLQTWTQNMHDSETFRWSLFDSPTIRLPPTEAGCPTERGSSKIAAKLADHVGVAGSSNVLRAVMCRGAHGHVHASPLGRALSRALRSALACTTRHPRHTPRGPMNVEPLSGSIWKMPHSPHALPCTQSLHTGKRAQQLSSF